MEARESPSWRYLTAWYVTSAYLLLLLPAWKFGLPVWRLPRSQWLPFAYLATAFVVSAGIAALLRPTDRRRALWLMALSTIANFGVVFFGFIVTRIDFSREITISTFLSAVVLVLAPYVVGASRAYRSYHSRRAVRRGSGWLVRTPTGAADVAANLGPYQDRVLQS